MFEDNMSRYADIINLPRPRSNHKPTGETPLREKAPDGEINVSGCMPYSLI